MREYVIACLFEGQRVYERECMCAWSDVFACMFMGERPSDKHQLSWPFCQAATFSLCLFSLLFIRLLVLMGGTFQPTAGVQGSAICQKAVKMALKYIFSVISHLSGFTL